MRSLFLFALTALLPLSAQTSVDQSPEVAPPPPHAATALVPSPEPKSAAISPTYDLPAPYIISPKLAGFAITPGTVREGFNYREGAKSVVTLSAPAIKAMACTVLSSDPARLACGSITLEKGQVEAKGTLVIMWKNIDHDCQVVVKVYDRDHPETILRSRIYLRKSHHDAKGVADLLAP